MVHQTTAATSAQELPEGKDSLVLRVLRRSLAAEVRRTFQVELGAISSTNLADFRVLVGPMGRKTGNLAVQHGEIEKAVTRLIEEGFLGEFEFRGQIPELREPLIQYLGSAYHEVATDYVALQSVVEKRSQNATTEDSVRYYARHELSHRDAYRQLCRTQINLGRGKKRLDVKPGFQVRAKDPFWQVNGDRNPFAGLPPNFLPKGPLSPGESPYRVRPMARLRHCLGRTRDCLPFRRRLWHPNFGPADLASRLFRSRNDAFLRDGRLNPWSLDISRRNVEQAYYFWDMLRGSKPTPVLPVAITYDQFLPLFVFLADDLVVERNTLRLSYLLRNAVTFNQCIVVY